MGRLLEGGLLRLAGSDAATDAAAAARLLPRVVHLMVPLVRSSTTSCRVVPVPASFCMSDSNLLSCSTAVSSRMSQ
jgi:hypothetical protein